MFQAFGGAYFQQEHSIHHLKEHSRHFDKLSGPHHTMTGGKWGHRWHVDDTARYLTSSEQRHKS